MPKCTAGGAAASFSSTNMTLGALVSKATTPPPPSPSASGLIVEEFSVVEGKADKNVKENQALFKSIGEHCASMDASCESLRVIVDQLRSKRIFLEDEASRTVAKMYIYSGHQSAKPDSLDKYCRNLCALLRCSPECVPDRPSITGSLPAWYAIGDEVDALIADEWWHAVVVDVKPRTVRVYWVGCAPQARSRRMSKAQSLDINPGKVDPKTLRWHQDDAKAGKSPKHDVTWIKDTYTAKEFGQPAQGRIHVSSALESEDETESDGKGYTAIKESPKKKRRSSPIKEQQQRSSPTAKVSSKRGRPGRGKNHSGRKDVGKKKKTTTERAGNQRDVQKSMTSDISVPSSEAAPAPPIAIQDEDPMETKPMPRLMPVSAHGNPINSKTPHGTASVEQFHWAASLNGDDDFCLATLEKLDLSDGDEDEDTLRPELERLLRNRCFALFNMYGNHGFMKLHEDAVEAVRNYEGKERPFDKAFLLKQLKAHAFILLPRMWSHLEILCVMFLLLDPKLYYLNINQKRGVENDQNR